MKKIFLFTLLLLSFFLANPQGKFAGTKKSLIGKTYSDSYEIPGLKGWQFREGSVISPIDSPEMITVDVFQKGTTYIVLLSIKEDTASSEFVIADVLEIKNVLRLQQVKTALCRDKKIENIELIAVIRSENKEYSKAIKAWRCNRDKRRIEIKNATTVDCLNEGFDQS